MANTQHARNAAQAAVAAYVMSPGISTENDVDTTIADLIADLMHLADSLEVSGEHLADRAASYYREEGER